MRNMTPARVAAACGGVYYGKESDWDQEISFITTDSRQAAPGCLFAAIRGEHADGHKFIPAVLQAGALLVITEKNPPEGVEGNFIRVESTIAALGAIAADYLAGQDIPVVGITGSVGKTSTKEMVAAVLSQKYQTLKTAGNFNNELGLPLTIFGMRKEDEIAVLEMGINHFGEMHRLASIARPDTCVITNIGPCHLEYLGDLDGVLRAKSEIFDFLQPDGHIVLNGDDEKLRTLQEVRGIRPIFFGLGKENDLYADEIEKLGLDGISCRIHTPQGEFQTTIPLPGIHMVMNALAGTAVGLLYGLTLDEIRDGIESLQPLSGRFNIRHTGRFTIIDDCYNANPASMRASLDVLQDALGRKVAILGDMAELGQDEEQIHRELGQYTGSLKLDLCICVGPLSAQVAAGIHEVNPQMAAVAIANLESLLAELPSLVQENDTILVKASHVMQFEKVVEALEQMS